MSRSPLRARTDQAQSRPRRWKSIGSAAVAALAMTLVAPTSASAAEPIIVGAIGSKEAIAAMSRAAGAPLAVHNYGKLNGAVPNGRFINMQSTVTWPAIASAKPGSSTHDNIVRWARTIKSRPGPIMFAFHHEPEASTSTTMGGSAAYVAAYRKVVDIFRAQGVRNVEYVWQMTSWAFATSPTDKRHATKWYPGDGYVTYVGVDPYNWYNCGSGRGKWQELKEVTDPSLAFAKKRGKKLVVAEFASQQDARRGQWVRNATQYFIQNRASIKAVFYFQYPARPGCQWILKSGGELDAFGDMARNRTYFRAS